MKQTRLELLCKVHNQQGGTIHQFNKQYNINFLFMSDKAFFEFIATFCQNNAKVLN